MEKEAFKSILKGLAGRRSGKALVSNTFKKGLNVKNKKKALEGYRRASRGGTDSFVAYLPTKAAEKIFGKDKVRDVMWKSLGKPLLKADTAAGNVLRKVPGGKNLFSIDEKVPWDNKGEFYRKIRRSSAVAPLVKARNVAAPMILGVAFEKGIDKAVDLTKNDTKPYNNSMAKSAHVEKYAKQKVLLEKAASAMLKLSEVNKEHEKRAQATRLLFKKAELGLDVIPGDYVEMQEKIAELMDQDLLVYEKALDLQIGGHTKLGELDDSDPIASNATEEFQRAILDDFKEVY